MTEYDNTNTFVLFANDKDGNEKRPDWKGKSNINGVELELAGWNRSGANGPFISGSVKPKEAPGTYAKKPPAPVPAHEAAFVDDDLPF